MNRSIRLIPILLCIALLTVTPMVQLLLTAFAPFGERPAAVFSEVMQRSSTWTATWHSLYTGVLATLLSLVLGGVFAVLVVLSDIRGKAALVFAFMLPMMIPPQVTALSWLQLFGPASPLLNTLGLAPPLGSPQPLYSAEGIALLMGVQHAPLVFLTLRAQLLQLPASLFEAAQINGASTRQLTLTMILPLMRGGLISAAVLAFVSALGNFGIPAMLGIPVSYYVLPTLIYQQMAGFGNDVLASVAALAILIGVLALAGVVWQHRLLKRSRFALLGLGEKPPQFTLKRRRLVVEIALWSMLAVILFAPLVALLVSSLVPALGVKLTTETATLAAYAEMFGRQSATLRAFANSLTLAVATGVILMVLSVLTAYLTATRQRLQGLVTAAVDLPYALPGIVLSIACILLFVKPLPIINVTLYGTLGIILVAYLMRFFAVALKPTLAAFAQLDMHLEQAAQLAGATPLQRLRDIVLPLVLPAVAAGGILVFLIAVNELTVSALLWSAGNETVGVMIFNLDEGGDSVLAAAVSVIVVAMVLLLMGLLNVFANRLPKGVIPWHN